MKRKQFFLIGALMALSVAAGALLVTDFNKVPFGFAGPGDVKLGADNPPVVPSNEAKSLNDAFVAVSKAVASEVVSITVTSKVTSSNRDNGDENGDDGQFDPFDMFRQFHPQVPQRGAGSGVIVTPDGYILTNNHVVESAVKGQIDVELNDGRHFDARLIGRDPLTDLAVVKIDAKNLPVAAFANSDDVQVGEIVIAVGNPLGLSGTVTQGIVSAIGRGQLGLNSRGDNGAYGVEDFIQTDAAINPGNSGGGLFDLKGALIGINSAIATGTGYYQGYGFAIPVNLARAVALDLMDDGKINRGYIGVQISPINQTMAKGLGLPQAEGVLVQQVMEDGAARAAGLKTGDVILKVDDQPVNTPNHLQSIIARKRAGDEVKLQVFRDGSTFEKSVKLKPRQEEAQNVRERAPTESDELNPESDRSIDVGSLGLSIRPLDSQTRKGRDVSGGVVVSDVEIYSEAYNQGIAKEDIILTVNHKPVNSPEEFRKIVDAAHAGDVLLMQVKDKSGSTRLVAVEVKKG
jgi:serine protease Do